jgi:predicted lipoprotein with Yx(FWY)xxD motif
MFQDKKRIALSIACGLLLAMLGTACGNPSGATTGNTGNTPIALATSTSNATNTGKVPLTPGATGTSKNNGQMTATPQATPSPVTTNTDENNNGTANQNQSTPTPAINNDNGQTLTPPPTTNNNDTMLISLRTITVNGASMNVLTDGQGMTLYYRTSDPAPASTCTGPCAKTWPPLLNKEMNIITSQTLPKELTVQQTANGQQVEYDGHPLYTYTGDKQMGQANGEGSGDVWHSVQIQAKKKHW